MTNLQPKIVNDEQGNLLNVRCPVLDLEGLITPTRLFYGVQHFGVPDAVSANEWRLTVGGQVQQPLELDYQTLRRLPARTVRTVMECSGSDMDYFDYFQGNAARPSRANDYMWLSAGEFTGAPLAAVLHHAGLTGKAVSIRAEGWDSGIPATPFPETAPDNPFNYDKALPLEKALHPDTIVAWAQNGEPLEHLHGAPVRLIVPGWSGNWSVKWLQRLEVLDNPGSCWYHYSFYYYGDSPDDPNKELITAIGVKSIITFPRDDGSTLPSGEHVVRGLAWSGAGPVTNVEVSINCGESWHAAHIEEPRDRWMWVRWSYLWNAKTAGEYSILARATDAVGRVQSPEPRYNNMLKNFSAIVPYPVTIK